MPEHWIILYRNADGISMLNGPGDLLEWPRLPVEAEVAYVGIPFADMKVNCYYAMNMREDEAIFCTRAAYADGMFSGDA